MGQSEESGWNTDSNGKMSSQKTTHLLLETPQRPALQELTQEPALVAQASQEIQFQMRKQPTGRTEPRLLGDWARVGSRMRLWTRWFRRGSYQKVLLP